MMPLLTPHALHLVKLGGGRNGGEGEGHGRTPFRSLCLAGYVETAVMHGRNS